MISASHPGQLMDWAIVAPPYALNYTANPGLEIAYIKDAFGWVCLRGFPQAASGTGNGQVGVFYTLPVGYRPASQMLFRTKTPSSGIFRLDIAANGTISIDRTTGTLAFPLGGIMFQAAA